MNAIMKLFIALLSLVFSCTVNAATLYSRGVGQTLAELMGDLAYFQVDNSPRARAKIDMLLNKAESEVAKNKAAENVLATKLTGKISLFLKDQDSKSKYDVEKFKNVVDAYEELVKVSLVKGRDDAGFLVLDFRYRYLSKTIASVNDGSITTVPMDRSLEESYEDADKVMKEVAAKQQGASAVRKWSFLRSKVADYNSYAIPALANSMILRIASDLGAAGQPVVAAAR